MKDVVEALEGIIEFLIQGSLMLVVILYFAAFAHPIPTLLRKYLADLWTAISGRNTPKGSANPIMIVLACAALYFLGTTSNVVNYWVLAPVHNSIIQEAREEGCPEVRQEGCVDNFARRGDFEFLTESLEQLITRRDQSQTAYDKYISDDAKWRDQNLEAHESILPSLRKYIRIVRGVAVASYAIFLIALLKSLVGLLIVFVARVPRKGAPNRVAWVLFRYLVSYAAYQDRSAEAKVGHDTLKRMVVPNLILAALGLVVFSVAIWSYRTIEYEFQLMVLFGASKGGPVAPGLPRLFL